LEYSRLKQFALAFSLSTFFTAGLFCATAQEQITEEFEDLFPQEEVIEIPPAPVRGPLTSDERQLIVMKAYEAALHDVTYKFGGRCSSTDIERLKTIDCSGLIEWVYRAALGIDIGQSMYSYDFTEITHDQLKPGDFATLRDKNAKPNHIVIYIGVDENGDDVFVNASATAGKVIVTTYNPYKHFYRMSWAE